MYQHNKIVKKGTFKCKSTLFAGIIEKSESTITSDDGSADVKTYFTVDSDNYTTNSEEKGVLSCSPAIPLVNVVSQSSSQNIENSVINDCNTSFPDDISKPSALFLNLADTSVLNQLVNFNDNTVSTPF